MAAMSDTTYRLVDGGVERVTVTLVKECGNGHPYTPDNVRFRGKHKDRLVCLTCERDRSREHKRAKAREGVS